MTPDESELEQRRRAAALAAKFEAVFFTDVRGRELLAYLTTRFAAPTQLKGGLDAVLTTYYRAGARDLLDFIHNQIEQAQRSAEPTETPLATDGATHG